jgi:hypothetical protein
LWTFCLSLSSCHLTKALYSSIIRGWYSRTIWGCSRKTLSFTSLLSYFPVYYLYHFFQHV